MCFDKINSWPTWSPQKCCHTVLVQVILLSNFQKVSLAMAILPLPPRAHRQQIFTRLCMCACACVCVSERAVCVAHLEFQQNSVSQSEIWRKLAICEK